MTILVFADIRSPGTVANICRNPAVELNVVDPLSRKGFRFKGTAEIVRDGELFAKMLDFYQNPPGRYEQSKAATCYSGIRAGEGGTSLAADFSRL